MGKVRIPYTPILYWHHEMARMKQPSRDDQVKRAASWADDPSELIDAYKASVELFRSYNNPCEDFLNRGVDGEPKRKPLPDPPPPEIDGTDPLVAWVKKGLSSSFGGDVGGRMSA